MLLGKLVSMTRAMLMIGREKTISAAAAEADFADAAHLTRTFYQMVGLPPSVACNSAAGASRIRR